MSITFYPSYDWKMVESTCTICADCDAPNAYGCTGTRRDPDCPTINMANDNALAMLALLGIMADYCGEVDADALPGLRRRIVGMQNAKWRRDPAVSDSYEAGGPGTGSCRVVYCGRDDEYISHRLGELLELVMHCQEKGCGFYWG